MEAKRILLVEDNDLDAELTLAALTAAEVGDGVLRVADGAEALDYLFRRGTFATRAGGQPLLVLLDLKMPKVDGIEVLRRVKADPELRTIPIVVMTSSKEERDIVESYRLGGNAYVVKPVSYDQLAEVVRRIGLFWIRVNEPPAGSVPRK